MKSCRPRSSMFKGSFHLGAAAVAAALTLGVCASAHAQWKWRDANNRVQYSDLPPPPSVPESAVLQRPAGAKRSAPAFTPAASAAPAAEAASAPKVDTELDARRKKADADKAAAEKAESDKAAAARAENCTRAKSYLKAVEEGQRMSRTNAKGEREAYDDKIRAEESKRTRDIIASDCK